MWWWWWWRAESGVQPSLSESQGGGMAVVLKGGPETSPHGWCRGLRPLQDIQSRASKRSNMESLPTTLRWESLRNKHCFESYTK